MSEAAETSLKLAPIEGTAADLRAALAAASLPTDDLAEAGRTFFCILRDEQTIGFVGFELHGQEALLRSLVILPKARGQGLGRAATALLLREAQVAGARHVYLLTDSAAGFFEGLDFCRIERTAAPAAILATRQAASLCPSTAALLVRPLAEEP